MNKLVNHFPPPIYIKIQVKELTIKPIIGGARVHPDTKQQSKLKNIIMTYDPKN